MEVSRNDFFCKPEIYRNPSFADHNFVQMEPKKQVCIKKEQKYHLNIVNLAKKFSQKGPIFLAIRPIF